VGVESNYASGNNLSPRLVLEVVIRRQMPNILVLLYIHSYQYRLV